MKCPICNQEIKEDDQEVAKLRIGMTDRHIMHNIERYERIEERKKDGK